MSYEFKIITDENFLEKKNKIIKDYIMGIFLETTYRMHSKVNQFISDAIYNGQLQAHPDNDKQIIQVPDGYQGILNFNAGVKFIPVEHEGNRQASDEEV